MFDQGKLKAFVTTLEVNIAGLNAEAAVAAMVRTAEGERAIVMGGQPKPSSYRQIVDGVLSAPLTSVSPAGVIIFEWQYLTDIVQDVWNALIARSPKYSSQYVRGLRLFVDGKLGAPTAIGGETREVKIVATVDYARRLEIGKRKGGGPFILQVKPRIVEETAIIARRLIGTLADVKFGYSDLTDAPTLRSGKAVVRYPTITIRPRV